MNLPVSLFVLTTINSIGSNHTIIDLIKTADPLVKSILILLFLLSVISWAIIFAKWNLFRKAKKESSIFLKIFRENRPFESYYDSSAMFKNSPLARIFHSVYLELVRLKRLRGKSPIKGFKEEFFSRNSEEVNNSSEDIELIKRFIKQRTLAEIARMESTIPFLATVGSTSPFIGLFGTVWGIMNSFRGLIGTTATQSISAVAPGISEALIATAAGLAAAIPAVVAYNFFLSKLRLLNIELEGFTGELLVIIERDLFRK